MQLNKAYNKEDFKDFLTGFLPNDLELNEKELVIGDNCKNIRSGLVLGESKLLGVKILYLEHEKEKDPRVALTTEAFKILSENWAKKALVVFNSKNSENWRLSLMTISFDINEKNKIVSNLSNPKRKSFFLGPNAKIATANQFLFSKGKVKDFADLESRFDVEIVTKEFFNNYKKLYTKLLDYLKNDRAFNVFSAKHGLELEIFTKKLLGQIVFIYFLQKKGWLGAKKGESISNGDKTFLRSLFEKCKNDGENFFNDCLEHLFYNCLNKLPERAGSFYREKFDCQIPFLNGGLFEPINDYHWQDEFINIPNEIFSNDKDGILDVFDLYNFTIDENTPDDQEISVDPEMLGKVFENLLESNTRKGQGAFYTPREIVHYMCRESLVNYLATNHSNLSEENIRNYINYGDSLSRDIAELGKNWKGEFFTPGQFSELNELLRNIKVVDPACGSGAFLVGMLQEIVRLRTFLQLTPDSELFSDSSNSIKELSTYDLKKETIQNCLYGVDIDPGAIDIAKLRFWLSIVVEENIEDIEPLPNLDYKIMQGNSLLEDLVIGDSVIPLKFEGKKKIDGRTKEKKDLFSESHQAKLFIDESEALVEKLERYHTEYFNITDPEKKKILKKRIDGVEDELIQSKCHEEIERAESFIKNNPTDSKKILKYTEKILAIKEVLRKWKKDHLRPFFPWKLHFGEVFNRKNRGFDIVIANPPYGADIDKKELKFIKSNLTDTKNGNSAAVFIDFGKNKWINESGTLSYIVPKSLLYSEAWLDLVLSMLEKIPFVVDVEKAFENVKLEQVVFMYGEKIKTNYYTGYKFLNNIFLRSTKIENSLVKKYKALICDVSQSELFIGEKILENDIEYLGAISETKRGVGLQKHLKKDGEHPVIGGKNIYKFGINGCKGYVCDDDLNSNKNKLEFLKQSKIISQNIVAHIQNPFPHMMIIATLDEEGVIFDLDTVNNTVITKKEYDYKFILGLLNSKLISWYAYKFIYCSAIRTMHFDNYYVGKIPIIKAEPEQQKEIIGLVDEIFKLTRSEVYVSDPEKQAGVLKYEKQLDQMVYELYGLIDEEIKVIEGE
ncbi:MAG: N-6 DNA methylase [Candidatus Moraniibacteriota bacterium]